MAKSVKRRKQAWKPSSKAVVIGTPLNNPVMLEARFTAVLEEMVLRMTRDVNREIKKFFDEPHAEEYFDTAQDASVSSQARILTNALSKKFNGIFASKAPEVAERQTAAAKRASTSALNTSLKDLSQGYGFSATTVSEEMREIMNASVVEQVSLIKSISVEYLSGVQGAVMRSITTGRGLADLQPFLEKHKEITLRRARMIAQDQTRKAFNNLNRVQMQDIGLKKFKWLHTAGSKHPRELHVAYNGMVFEFDDPPLIDEKTGEHGIPGQAINCRCRMAAVIDFEKD